MQLKRTGQTDRRTDRINMILMHFFQISPTPTTVLHVDLQEFCTIFHFYWADSWILEHWFSRTQQTSKRAQDEPGLTWSKIKLKKIQMYKIKAEICNSGWLVWASHQNELVSTCLFFPYNKYSDTVADSFSLFPVESVRKCRGKN